MYDNSQKQVSNLRALDAMFREWKLPRGFALRITRNETFGYVNVCIVHRGRRIQILIILTVKRSSALARGLRKNPDQ